MPIWTILDVTPEGRGTDWYPKLELRLSVSNAARLDTEARGLAIAAATQR